MDFLKISDLSLEKENWKNSTFITIDVDWASDYVLADTLKLLEKEKLFATILLTHHTDLIQEINSKANLELGIHPNFNFLLEGDLRYGKNYEEVIEHHMKIVPNAKVVRSHSVASSTKILECFKKFGLEYDLNLEIPHSSKIALKPYKDWTGLVKVPYFWQENISFGYEWDLKPKNFLNNTSLKVFNFHPIHIFLNSDSMKRYQNSKKYLNNMNKLRSHVNHEEYGARNFFIDLVREVNGYGK